MQNLYTTTVPNYNSPATKKAYYDNFVDSMEALMQEGFKTINAAW